MVLVNIMGSSETMPRNLPTILYWMKPALLEHHFGFWFGQIYVGVYKCDDSSVATGTLLTINVVYRGRI